ncbi:MarR family transcriptional regulator [Streptomyces sp. H34-S4]|uniref:MarR family transcriptional regulator n=1 Tax=Streptomyces sp. H34-S4 TaxID=2996463 RepID=UPI00226E342A|nr:MarR family transcriptional regulator [Streptomyces sp. H34-S4]MCY0938426.1 MarR family transcriptional regulator [Streptomyces sp. H34-S4]
MRRTARRKLVNTQTGEVHELHEQEDPLRRSYNLGGRFGQFSFERIMAMLGKESGITGDDLRVFFYCAILTYEMGGASAKEAAEHLGLTPQATRRIAKKLAENRIFLVAETVGRTIKYRASPHIVSSLTGEEQSQEAAAYHLPTLPGKKPATSKDRDDVTPKPVPRARRTATADKRTAAPEAEHAHDVRDLRRAGTLRGEDGSRAG